MRGKDNLIVSTLHAFTKNMLHNLTFGQSLVGEQEIKAEAESNLA